MPPEFKKKWEQMIDHKMNGEWDQYFALMDELLEELKEAKQ